MHPQPPPEVLFTDRRRIAIGDVAWRERPVAVRAHGEGAFTTEPLPVAGARLCVNARVHRAGCLRLGLAGVEGRSPDACDLVTGDGRALPVTWQGQAEARAPAGRPAALRLELRAAEAFALHWQP